MHVMDGRREGGVNSAYRGVSPMQGVPPCQHRMSLRIAQPAGIGQTVDIFIHCGSSARDGIGSFEFCVPGTKRIAAAGPIHNIMQSHTHAGESRAAERD